MILASASDFGLSFILELVGLVLVVGLVLRYAWPYLRTAMDKQAEKIRTQLSAGDEARAQAAALVAERRAALEQAKSEAQLMVEQARQSAVLLGEDGVRRAAEDYERGVVRATAEVEAVRARVEAEIMSELSEVIFAAASEVVEAELDLANQHRLIGQAISAAEAEAQ